MPLRPIPTDVSPSREELGRRAAAHVVKLLQGILAAQPRARVVFACAPSQNEFLAALITQSQGVIDWSHVDGFHMDEYIGLRANHPASFRTYLRQHFLDHVPLGSFAEIHGEATDTAAEAARISLGGSRLTRNSWLSPRSTSARSASASAAGRCRPAPSRSRR